MQIADVGNSFHSSRLSGFQYSFIPIESFYQFTVRIGQSYPITETACFAAVVSHLRLGMYLRLTTLDIEIGCIYIYTGCFQIAV